MNSEMLRKVQLVQFEILEEFDRICKKNNIKYFLTGGTLIGAVRHQGFIPWDDDLDIGMLREDYNKFCKIVDIEINEKYCFQNWNNTYNFPLPYGKIRKKNTLYVENKAKKLEENGIFIDILLYDNAPSSIKERRSLIKKLNTLERMILAKSGFKPWLDNDKIIIKKRIGYIYYEVIGSFFSIDKIINKYEKLVNKYQDSSEYCYNQSGEKKVYFFKKKWFSNIEYIIFEGKEFPVIKGYKQYLKLCYGDYMKLPPIEQRENMHQIIELKL